MQRLKRIGIVRHQRTLIRRPVDVVQDDFPLVITHIRRKDCRQKELRTRLRVNDFALRPRCTPFRLFRELAVRPGDSDDSRFLSASGILQCGFG